MNLETPRRPLRPEDLFDEALKLKERAERAEAEVKAIRAALGDDLLEWKISNCTLRAEVERLRTENVCLQELIQEFYEWSRRDYPTEAEVREIMDRYHDLLNK
jgi:hypothetical protein